MIFSKTPSTSWKFYKNSFITTISSDTLLYTSYDSLNGDFCDIRSLKTVNLNAIKNIGSYSFYSSGCGDKKGFTFNGPKVKTVGEACFYMLTNTGACSISLPKVESLGGSNCFYRASGNSMDIYINGNISQPPTIVYNSISQDGTFKNGDNTEKIKVHVKSSMKSAFLSATNWALFIADETIELVV